MKKVLFIANHRYDRNPGQRFRFEQYFDYLRENGFECHLSFIISEKDDKILYAPGNLPQKALLAMKAVVTRSRNVFAARQYDIIFIFREAFFTGSILFEKLLKRSGAKIIFDFDDAIWNFDVSEANKKLSFLKNPDKTAKIIEMSDLVFAGNQYLADYAGRYNKNVVIIPTTIDTEEYIPGPFRSEAPVCIGWSGSITTINHFKTALPVLRRIKKMFGDQVTFKVVGDGTFYDQELDVKGIAWTKQDELNELRSMDIGIMPLPDDQWSKGKCGLKGLQYMALQIATVMSPVGVNADIIRDGVNGMLAGTEDEWIDKLSKLISDAALRKRLGEEGRKTVLEKFSVEAQKNNYLRYFNLLTQPTN